MLNVTSLIDLKVGWLNNSSVRHLGVVYINALFLDTKYYNWPLRSTLCIVHACTVYWMCIPPSHIAFSFIDKEPTTYRVQGLHSLWGNSLLLTLFIAICMCGVFLPLYNIVNNHLLASFISILCFLCLVFFSVAGTLFVIICEIELVC